MILKFLGTAASTATPQRGLPALLAIFQRSGRRWLIDCGEGTSRQLIRARIGLRLDAIAITHRDLDHIWGLGGVLSSLDMLNHPAYQRLEILGSTETLQAVRRIARMAVFHDLDQLHFHPLERGETLPLAQDPYEYRLRAIRVEHRQSGDLGFRFEKQSFHRLSAEKIRALGLSNDERRGRLQQGQPVATDDGRWVHPEQVWGDFVPGTSVVVLGDVARYDGLEASCRGADVLVTEATFLAQEAVMAREKGHVTVAESSEFARAAGIRQVIFTHISSRYSPVQILAEAQQHGPGVQFFAANDFDAYQVSSTGQVSLVEYPLSGPSRQEQD